MTIRLVLDACAVDALLDDADRRALYRDAIADGRLELLWTHVTPFELSATPDADRRAKLVMLGAQSATHVPAGVVVLDHPATPLDGARLWDDGEVSFEELRAGNPKNTNDAIVCATAVAEGCGVLTAEVKGLRGRAQRQGIPVYLPAELDLVLRAVDN